MNTNSRIVTLADSMNAIVAKAETEKRDLTADEREAFDRMDIEARSLDLASRTRPRVADMMEIPAAVADARTRGTFTPGDYRAVASVTVPFASGPGSFAFPDARSVATSTTGLPRLAADPATMKAVASFARTGVRTFSNAMSIGSDPDGGYEVPIQLDVDLQTVAANFSPLLALAKGVSGATDGYRANVSTNLPASAWRAEGDTRSVTNSPTIAQIVPQRGAVSANVQASQWLYQDSYHDLYAFLISELGRQFGAAIGTAITTGAAGQPAPKGLTAQTLAATPDATRAFGTVEYIATGGATTAPSIDNCITALAHLHPYYHANAAWIMSPSAAAALMTEKASSAGSYQWQPDLSAAQPPTLLGKPVYIDPCLPAATTGNAYSVWLGDWKRAYVVVRYGRPILVRDDVTSKGNVLLYSEQRVGGNLVDSAACKAIKTAVS